jgi:hypothetical protein
MQDTASSDRIHRLAYIATAVMKPAQANGPAEISSDDPTIRRNEPLETKTTSSEYARTVPPAQYSSSTSSDMPNSSVQERQDPMHDPLLRPEASANYHLPRFYNTKETMILQSNENNGAASNPPKMLLPSLRQATANAPGSHSTTTIPIQEKKAQHLLWKEKEQELMRRQRHIIALKEQELAKQQAAARSKKNARKTGGGHTHPPHRLQELFMQHQQLQEQEQQQKPKRQLQQPSNRQPYMKTTIQTAAKYPPSQHQLPPLPHPSTSSSSSSSATYQSMCSKNIHYHRPIHRSGSRHGRGQRSSRAKYPHPGAQLTGMTQDLNHIHRMYHRLVAEEDLERMRVYERMQHHAKLEYGQGNQRQAVDGEPAVASSPSSSTTTTTTKPSTAATSTTTTTTIPSLVTPLHAAALVQAKAQTRPNIRAKAQGAIEIRSNHVPRNSTSICGRHAPLRITKRPLPLTSSSSSISSQLSFMHDHPAAHVAKRICTSPPVDATNDAIMNINNDRHDHDCARAQPRNLNRIQAQELPRMTPSSLPIQPFKMLRRHSLPSLPKQLSLPPVRVHPTVTTTAAAAAAPIHRVMNPITTLQSRIQMMGLVLPSNHSDNNDHHHHHHVVHPPMIGRDPVRSKPIHTIHRETLGWNVKDVSLNELRPHFNKPMAVVAKELGVCITLMKKICRKNGLTRWPHRRIRSLVNRITSLQVVRESVLDVVEKARFEAHILSLRRELSDVIQNPNGKSRKALEYERRTKHDEEEEEEDGMSFCAESGRDEKHDDEEEDTAHTEKGDKDVASHMHVRAKVMMEATGPDVDRQDMHEEEVDNDDDMELSCFEAMIYPKGVDMINVELEMDTRETTTPHHNHPHDCPAPPPHHHHSIASLLCDP